MTGHWRGWVRYWIRGALGPWQVACEADHEADVWRYLDKIPDEHGDGRPVSKVALEFHLRPDRGPDKGPRPAA